MSVVPCLYVTLVWILRKDSTKTKLQEFRKQNPDIMRKEQVLPEKASPWDVSIRLQ